MYTWSLPPSSKEQKSYRYFFTSSYIQITHHLSRINYNYYFGFVILHKSVNVHNYQFAFITQCIIRIGLENKYKMYNIWYEVQKMSWVNPKIFLPVLLLFLFLWFSSNSQWLCYCIHQSTYKHHYYPGETETETDKERGVCVCVYDQNIKFFTDHYLLDEPPY